MRIKWANIQNFNLFKIVGALTESLKVLEKFRISERKVQIIAMIG